MQFFFEEDMTEFVKLAFSRFVKLSNFVNHDLFDDKEYPIGEWAHAFIPLDASVLRGVLNTVTDEAKNFSTNDLVIVFGALTSYWQHVSCNPQLVTAYVFRVKNDILVFFADGTNAKQGSDTDVVNQINKVTVEMIRTSLLYTGE